MTNPTRRNLITYFLVISSLFLSGGKFGNRSTLLIGAIPDQNPERLNRLYGLLAAELKKELEVDVKYIPVTNYPAAVSAFRTRSLDLVWFGGLTGVQARLQRPGAKVIAQRDIDAKFRSVFIASIKSNIPIIKNQSGLKILKGKRFTFGSESSTSGRLMPQYFLQQSGVKITDFKGGRPGFSGSHDATLMLVQSGSYEVGALNKQVFEERVRRNKVDNSKVQVIWETPTYADYHWLAQPDLDNRFGKGFTKKIKRTLLGLNRESKYQAKILDLFGAKKFISANESQYIKIEKIGRHLGKIK